MLMVNLGSTEDSRYSGFGEVTDSGVLDLQCSLNVILVSHGNLYLGSKKKKN